MPNHYVPEKQRMYGGSVYQAAPQAPTLEIKINQNNSPAPSVYSEATNGYSRHPAPSVPPPPPPVTHPSTNPYYASPKSTYSGKGGDSNTAMLRICILQLLLGLLLLAAGVPCFRNTEYCPYGSAMGTAIFFIGAAVLGCIASRMGNQKLYVAHLTLSIVAIMVCIVGCISAGYNWSVIGTYHHPKISRDHAFCLMGEHDAPRISYIFSHMDQYNFRKCLFELKLGLAVNTFHFVISIVMALLNLGSVYLCVRKVCNW